MTSKRHAEITCPYYRRYKNKKKSLRRAFQNGSISADERKARLVEAKRDYLEKMTPVETNQAWYIGHQYLDDIGGPSRLLDATAFTQDSCDEACVGARGTSCACPCLGLNHGAAIGREPHEVVVEGMTRLERVEAGILQPEHLVDADLERWVEGGRKFGLQKNVDFARQQKLAGDNRRRAAQARALAAHQNGAERPPQPKAPVKQAPVQLVDVWASQRAARREEMTAKDRARVEYQAELSKLIAKKDFKAASQLKREHKERMAQL